MWGCLGLRDPFRQSLLQRCVLQAKGVGRIGGFGQYPSELSQTLLLTKFQIWSLDRIQRARDTSADLVCDSFEPEGYNMQKARNNGETRNWRV